MRRTAIVAVLAATLSLLVAAPAIGRTPSGLQTGSPKVTITTAEQGSLHIDVAQAGGTSTTVALSYRLENGAVTESLACIGQRNETTDESTWGCGPFAFSALKIGRAVSRADLAPVAIPVDQCTASGCVAATMTIAASLTSVRSTYDSGATTTRTRVGACRVVTSNYWENAAGVGVLSIDGVAYQVAGALDTAGEPAPAISRAPSITRTTCQ